MLCDGVGIDRWIWKYICSIRSDFDSINHLGMNPLRCHC